MSSKPSLTDRLKEGNAAAIREARLALGWSQAKLAEEAGTSQQTVDRIERGLTLHSRALDDVKDVLGLPRARRSEEMDQVIKSVTAASVDLTKVGASGSLGMSGLPLFGMGIDSSLPGPMTGIQSHPDRYMLAPEILQHAHNAYALAVFGADEMSPVFREGDIALINPDAPLRPECEVVLRSENTAAVALCTLVSVSEESWLVRHWSPEREIEMSRADWPRIHAVVGKFSR
ncbi:helix-turn-helix protein [compost metagenome]